MTTDLDAARDDLAELATLWPLLAETRIPGALPPWRLAELTAEQRAERDYQARLDRFDTDAIGWSVAPLHLDVVDVLTWLAADLGELADVTADGAGLPAPTCPRRWPTRARSSSGAVCTPGSPAPSSGSPTCGTGCRCRSSAHGAAASPRPRRRRRPHVARAAAAGLAAGA